MNPVINVIFFRQAASQLNLNRLEPLRLAYRTAFLAIISPILPAVGLYMGAITDTPLGAVDINTDRFKPLCLTHCAADFPLSYVVLPAVALHMGLIGQNVLAFLHKRPSGRAGGSAILFNDTDLDRFHLLIKADCPRDLSVFCPIQPSIGFGMNPIIQIILLGGLACQFKPDSLNSLTVSSISVEFSGFFPALPSVFN